MQFGLFEQPPRRYDSLEELLAEMVELTDGANVRIIAPDQIVRLWSGSEGSWGDLLVGTDRNEHVELWRWQLSGEDRHESEGHLPGTRELIAVLSGVLTLEVDDASHDVQPGGAVLFEADRPHAYVNTRRRTVDMVLVVVQPPVVEPGALSHPG